MKPFDKSTIFAHRPPSEKELTKFKLLLSTFQDGTGMLAVKDSLTLPGWRDFERVTALAFEGIPSENKDVMDVRLPDLTREDVFFGVSCKMRRELDRVKRDGRVTIELSNAARSFWDRLGEDGIHPDNYRGHADLVGTSIINLVSEWHLAVSIESEGNIDLTGSCHLTLMWNKEGRYQLHQFGIQLPDPNALSWYCPNIQVKGGGSRPGNSIRGDDGNGTLIEWYGQSGGQLKYYPNVSDALWHSEVFKLEPLPPNTAHGLISKVQEYYPDLWPW